MPALRGNNLLAVWSVKAWMENIVVHHNQADHWHGYFRVADHLLPQVLVRSGAAGIFLNPKTAERKHDPRFTTLALPSKQLNEVAAKAEACAKVLGLVKRVKALPLDVEGRMLQVSGPICSLNQTLLKLQQFHRMAVCM